MNQHNNPKIRFKGYDNSLEKKTIGDITTSFSGGTPKSSNKTYYEGNIPFIRSGEIKLKQTELFISDEALKNSSAKMVEKGDILYALYGATSGEVAISQINGAINQAILAIKPNSGYSSEFIMNYLKKEKDNILEKYLQGGQGNLSAAIVKSIELHLPSQEEQSAIGSLFLTLDELLASYKDNLANYQSLKATMLSKMFPKAGQTAPEIRLDGFEGEWDCLKMAEIFKIIDGDRGKSYPGENDFQSVGHTLFLDTGNVKKTGLDFSTTKFISEKKDKELRNGKLILGDFILTSRGTLGNVALYDKNIQKKYSSVRINSAMLILRPLLGDKISSDYILAVLRGNLISDFMRVNQVGYAQPHITKKEFSKVKVLVPSNIREQQAIGAYFSNLDNLITSHQEKISQLETLKKKLLHDMFI